MIALIDGNNFFVSCERVVNPKLKGRPVAVLSNNDGCCVSRSNEFKALGIAMGTPYFQIRHLEAPDENHPGLIFRSSNFELYGDLSRRIVEILHDETPVVEQYSIDEAFICPPAHAARDYSAYGRMLRAKILRWVGIPCGIGFAPTKTLAKIANHIGKKRPAGVFVLPEDPTDILAETPVREVWGVGRHQNAKLDLERIVTARDLRDAPDDVIRGIGGVTLLRTALELRGIACLDERDFDAAPDFISHSRCFGEPIVTADALTESIASYLSQAARKLRSHHQLAAGCNIYAQYGAAHDNTFTSRTVVFEHPTDATNDMLRAVRRDAQALFLPGAHYRKSGIVFFGLEREHAAQQLDLFNARPATRPSKLFEAVDNLNARFGRDTVTMAAEGCADAAWQMKRTNVSKRATTCWDELITVS